MLAMKQKYATFFHGLIPRINPLKARWRVALRAAVALVIFVAGSARADADPTFHVVSAFPKLKLHNPVDLQAVPGKVNELWVVEQEGRVLAFQADPKVQETRAVLDIVKKVKSGGEMGLLGLAFDPDFKKNGFFYVNYTADDPLRSVNARYHKGADGKADAASELVILSYDQPYENHNGGDLVFGPDGYLYIGTGDGGSGGDPHGNGQNLQTLLGKMLRLDVRGASGENPYSLPPDNPFTKDNRNRRGEIWAWGLRNPWRFSFDGKTGKLWAGDVGQNRLEEVDIIEKGGNYGWNYREGFSKFKGEPPLEAKLKDPVHDYPRGEGQCVTGGYVYRGKKLPSLVGAYIYGDFASGRIWALRIPAQGKAQNRLIAESGLNISSFGLDAQGELLILHHGGEIYRLEAGGP